MTDPALQNVRAIADLERRAFQQRSRLQRFTERVTDFAGSGPFMLAHALWFIAWLLMNRGGQGFDPYPFNLLTLIVSLEAIFLTSFVLMTQNSMTRQADRRAHLDLQVNLLAEQELTTILHMLNALCQKFGTCVKVSDARVEQLLKETDIVELAVTLDKELKADS